MSLDLDPIKARADAATLGPWKSSGPWFPLPPKVRQLPDSYSTVETGEGTVADLWPWTDHEANAAFIAAARSDVPALVAEVERMRAENERLADAYDSLKSDADAVIGRLRAKIDGPPEMFWDES